MIRMSPGLAKAARGGGEPTWGSLPNRRTRKKRWAAWGSPQKAPLPPTKSDFARLFHSILRPNTIPWDIGMQQTQSQFQLNN
jgi:hypothetical protein